MKDSLTAMTGNHDSLEQLLRLSKRYLIVRVVFRGSFLLTGVVYILLELVLNFSLIFFLTLPAGTFLVIWKGVTGKDVFQRKAIVGRTGKMITLATFAVNWPILENLSLFFHVVIGRIGQVGLTWRK